MPTARSDLPKRQMFPVTEESVYSLYIQAGSDATELGQGRGNPAPTSVESLLIIPRLRR